MIALAVLIWSGIKPRDFFTWVLEVSPGVAGIALLVAIYWRFRFTTLVYMLIALHAIVLFVGGHYTYAQVPLFDWVRDTFHLQRNHYDRVGHFMQGFVPALIAREVLLRNRVLKRENRIWLPFLVICVCMTISAVYELIEWLVAIISGASADAFLGGQGDVWDTQKDMAWCLVGAVVALLTLARWHDRQLNALLPD